MTFVLVDKNGKTMEVEANSIVDATMKADEQDFQVWDWEIKEGEDFDTR